MIRSRLPWFVAMLAGAALIAGCGSSSSNSTASSTTSSPATAATTASTGTTSSAPSTVSVPKGLGSPEQEIAACKKGLEAQTSFPAALKARLEADCVKAAHGDKAAIKQGARELCEEVVRNAHLAVGPAKEKAIALCKASK